MCSIRSKRPDAGAASMTPSISATISASIFLIRWPSRLVLQSGEMTIALKTAYDESTSQFAPGLILLQEFLRHQFESSKGTRIEFYTNATDQQIAWSTDTRTIFHVTLFPSRFVQRSYELASRVRSEISSRWPTFLSQVTDES